MPTHYCRFIFLTTPTRIHIAAWNDTTRRWEVPCGLKAAGPSTIDLDKPLCKTCDKLTFQMTPDEVLEDRLR